MSADAPRSGGPLGSLGKGAKWLGGIVIVALVGALVPLIVDRLSGPDELGAKLDKVRTRSPVTLAQFKASRRTQPASFQGERITLRLAAADVGAGPADESGSLAAGPSEREARATKDEAAAPAETTPRKQLRTSPPATTTTPQVKRTPDARTTPKVRTTPDIKTTPDRDSTREPGPATTTGDGDPIVPLELAPGVAESLSTGIAQAAQATRTPILLPPDCLRDAVQESCGLLSLQLRMGAADASLSPEKARKRLTEIFNATRTRRAKSDPAKRELIGVTVDFNVQLTGFRGKTVDIRWELLTDGGDAEVPSALSGRERVLLLKGEADKDTAGDEFWVPMPKAQGPGSVHHPDRRLQQEQHAPGLRGDRAVHLRA